MKVYKVGWLILDVSGQVWPNGFFVNVAYGVDFTCAKFHHHTICSSGAFHHWLGTTVSPGGLFDPFWTKNDPFPRSIADALGQIWWCGFFYDLSYGLNFKCAKFQHFTICSLVRIIQETGTILAIFWNFRLPLPSNHTWQPQTLLDLSSPPWD